jgi:hypothetical protein
LRAEKLVSHTSRTIEFWISAISCSPFFSAEEWVEHRGAENDKEGSQLICFLVLIMVTLACIWVNAEQQTGQHGGRGSTSRSARMTATSASLQKEGRRCKSHRQIKWAAFCCSNETNNKIKEENQHDVVFALLSSELQNHKTNAKGTIRQTATNPKDTSWQQWCA